MIHRDVWRYSPGDSICLADAIVYTVYIFRYLTGRHYTTHGSKERAIVGNVLIIHIILVQ